jgi:hypothetical protein
MLSRPRIATDDHDAQTVRSLRALLALVVACALFVLVAISAVSVRDEPALAAHLPEPSTTDAAAGDGG